MLDYTFLGGYDKTPKQILNLKKLNGLLLKLIMLKDQREMKSGQ